MNEALTIIAFRLALAAHTLAHTSAPSAHAIKALRVYPSQISLTSARDSQSVIVQAEYANGITGDLTDKAIWKLDSDNHVMRNANRFQPKSDGDSKLTVTYESSSVDVPISVKHAAVDPPISFKLDVMPVFMRAGCNAGSCHGSARGKDGFRLSLFGFDPDGDWYRITHEQPERTNRSVDPDRVPAHQESHRPGSPQRRQPHKEGRSAVQHARPLAQSRRASRQGQSAHDRCARSLSARRADGGRRHAATHRAGQVFRRDRSRRDGPRRLSHE